MNGQACGASVGGASVGRSKCAAVELAVRVSVEAAVWGGVGREGGAQSLRGACQAC